MSQIHVFKNTFEVLHFRCRVAKTDRMPYKLQVIFRKKATNSRVCADNDQYRYGILLTWILDTGCLDYKHKASYDYKHKASYEYAFPGY